MPQKKLQHYTTSKVVDYFPWISWGPCKLRAWGEGDVYLYMLMTTQDSSILTFLDKNQTCLPHLKGYVNNFNFKKVGR